MGKNNETIFRIVDELIDIEIKIYDSMKILLQAENDGMLTTSTYLKEIEHLKVYLTKENRLFDKIPDDMIETATEYLLQMMDIYMLSFIKSDAILRRVTNFLRTKAVDIFEDDDEYELYNYIGDENISKSFNLKYLEHLQNLIDNEMNSDKKSELLTCKYLTAFILKEEGDELIYAGGKGSNLFILDDELEAEIMGITVEDYKKKVQNSLFLLSQDLIDDLLNDSGMFDFKIIIMLEDEKPKEVESEPDFERELIVEKLLFILKKLETIYLCDLKDVYTLCREENKKNKEKYDEIIEKIQDEILSRNDYKNERTDFNSDCFEINEDGPRIDECLFDKLSTLIKLDEYILKIYNDIYLLKISNSENEIYGKMKELSSLLEMEKDLANNITISNVSDIQNLIDNYLEFFINENGLQSFERKKEIIRRRIYSVIPGLYLDNIPSSQLTRSSDIIDYNQKMEALVSASNLYNKTENKEKKQMLLRIIFDETFSDSKLTSDFIISDGEFSSSFIFDHEISASWSGISLTEYLYDRQEQLFYLASDEIIEDIIELLKNDKDDLEKWGIYVFKILQIKNIYKYLNDENRFIIKEILKEIKGNNENKKTNAKVKKI